MILYGGCNTHISSFSVKGNKINFGHPASTRKYCPDDKDSSIVEQLFKNSAYFELRNSKLVFYDAKFQTTLSLTTIIP